MKTPLFNYEEKNDSLIVYADTRIEDLASDGRISVRASNVCHFHNIHVVSDILKLGNSLQDFISLKNCGRKTATELFGLINSLVCANVESVNMVNFNSKILSLFENFFDSLPVSDFSNFFKGLFPTAKDLYSVLLQQPNMTVSSAKYEDLTVTERFLYRSEMITLLVNLSDIITTDKEINDESTLILSAISNLKKEFNTDYQINYFKFILPIEAKTYLKAKFELLLENAPTRVKTLHLSQIKSVENLLPFLQLDVTNFTALFGNKKKSAIEYYLNIVVPFKEVYESVTSGKTNNKLLEIQYKFRFLKEKEIEFVSSFYQQYHYYPMFFIAERFLVNSSSREHDMICRHYGLGKYVEAQTIDEIASSYSLSRERVRQILSKPILKKIGLFNSDEWLSYFKLGNILITEKSEYYLDITSSENFDYPFKAFALFYSVVFNYVYCDKYTEYIVDSKYAEIIDSIFNKLNQLMNKNFSSDTLYSVYEIFDSQISDDDFLKSLILSDISSLLDIEVKHNKLFFPQNHIDISSEVYEYLYTCGEPKHIEEIISFLSEKYPYKTFLLSNVKFRIRENDSIQPVGKTSMLRLSHWRNIYGGSIRNLIRDILSQSKEPLHIDLITDKVTDVYDSTNKKNVQSSISSCDDFIPYVGGLWGLKEREYSSDFIIADLSRSRNTFAERFDQYKSFVSEFQRHPYLSGIDEEESLKRWQVNVLKRVLDVTDEQVEQLEQFINENSHLPVNGREVNFYKNCKEYMSFVEREFVLPSNPHPLYFWFNKHINSYQEYNDNRAKFFSNLISELNAYGFYFS